MLLLRSTLPTIRDPTRDRLLRAAPPTGPTGRCVHDRRRGHRQEPRGSSDRLPHSSRPAHGRPADAGDQATVRVRRCESQTTLHRPCGQHWWPCAGHAQSVCTAWGQRWGRSSSGYRFNCLTRAYGRRAPWRKSSSRGLGRTGHSRFLTLTPALTTATGPAEPTRCPPVGSAFLRKNHGAGIDHPEGPLSLRSSSTREWRVLGEERSSTGPHRCGASTAGPARCTRR